ncbi:DUF6438 domain-containing protein [Mucilaginibacter roseus]|uniref:DUF6438 domain-containing protein n=1 Tax=Mucilaginibacter roseus TaxID=1528868 RepID=A0ABS8U387_9SPHI|nr:DUF6438 domain-containing protein [Mucilaginibacter roseus]MCD8741561.1 DUF6438 domain-containing protein [Mucilaginibacter roseus]
MKLHLALIFLLFCSCNNKAEINKIELSTGFCLGDCQPVTISIDRTLKYNFYGDGSPFSNSKYDDRLYGYYTGTMTKSLWDSITNALEKINYKELDTSYEHSIDDQSLEIFIHYGNKVKHIKAQSASLPRNVAKVFYSIERSYKYVSLKRADTIIKFEHTKHY